MNLTYHQNPDRRCPLCAGPTFDIHRHEGEVTQPWGGGCYHCAWRLPTPGTAVHILPAAGGAGGGGGSSHITRRWGQHAADPGVLYIPEEIIDTTTVPAAEWEQRVSELLATPGFPVDPATLPRVVIVRTGETLSQAMERDMRERGETHGGD